MEYVKEKAYISMELDYFKTVILSTNTHPWLSFILYPITNCSGIFVPHFCLSDLIKNKIHGTVTKEKGMLEIQLIISGGWLNLKHTSKTCRLFKWEIELEIYGWPDFEQNFCSNLIVINFLYSKSNIFLSFHHSFLLVLK